MKYTIIILTILMTISCASTPKTIYVPQKQHQEPEKVEQEEIAREDTEYIEIKYNEPSSEESESTNTKESGLKAVHTANVNSVAKVLTRNMKEGRAEYFFKNNVSYPVFTALYSITDIVLGEGEHLVDNPKCGDPEMFNIELGISGAAHNLRNHIYIKPYDSGQETDLILNTNKRTYYIVLKSYKRTYMKSVSWKYLEEENKRQNNQFQMVQNSFKINGDISNFYFGYKINHLSIDKPVWTPSIIFDDGIRTYIFFPSGKRMAYAPVYVARDEENEPIVVNYRIVGNYYIIDRVVNRADLVLDVDSKNIITITRETRFN